MLGVALLSLSCSNALAAPIDLLGQLDPVAGTNAYGDVWAEGDFAYLGAFVATGVFISDISDPANPTLATTYSPFSGRFQDVKVFDVSSPASPVFVRDVVTPDRRIRDVTALGTRLYASGIGNGFSYIYDTRDIGASAPPLIGTVSTGSSSHACWASAS